MKNIVVISAASIGAYFIGKSICKKILTHMDKQPTEVGQMINEYISLYAGVVTATVVAHVAADLIIAQVPSIE